MSRMDARSRNTMNRDKVRNLKFGRYLLLRYTLAFFFFINLYWLLTCLIDVRFAVVFPTTALIVMIRAIIEQFTLLSRHGASLHWTKLALAYQLLLQIIVIMFIMFGEISQLFPIFTNTGASNVLLICWQIVGAMIVVYSWRRCEQIEKNMDRYFFRMKHIYE